jgi:hypothetical protein
MTTTTDTPRTDAARERYYDGKTSDWVHYTICGMIERELNASKAEVERLKSDKAHLITENICLQESEAFWKTEAAKAEIATIFSFWPDIKVKMERLAELDQIKEELNQLNK